MAIRNLKQYIEVHRELYQHLSFEGDGIEIILKGHLLLESLLEKILKKSAQNPNMISEANLSFHKLACIVQAINESKCALWVWKAVFDLNIIRNKLAHNLDFPELDKKIEDFIEFVRENGDGTLKVGDELELSEISMAIVNVHSELWRLLDAVEA